MASTRSGTADIYYEMLDLTAPWIEQPETILFNHGIGINRQIWMKWLPALIERYRIVLMDMRGFGKSTVPAANEPWSMDVLTDDLLAVARAARVDRFHFVGESMGGTVGLCAYLRSPDSFRTITVSNGAHVGGNLENLNDWRDVIDKEGMSDWSEMMSDRRFFPDGLPEDELKWFTREQASCSPDSCLSALDVLRGVDLTPQLGLITCPVMLLHGDSSPFIRISVTAELHAGLPDSVVKIFPRAKHGLPFSHGHECGRELRAFLDRTRR